MTVSAPNIKVGTTTGTGAALNIPLGFAPAYVKVWNITDGDIIHEWYTGMTDGHALQSGNHASTQFSRITSNGISAYAGSDASAAIGITLGTAISENGKTLGYMAVGQ